MPRRSDFVYCVGSALFDPKVVIEDAGIQGRVLEALDKDDLRDASRILLQLPDRDDYTYHAITSVKLAQVQHVVNLGRANGLHTWYRSSDKLPIDPPPRPDIEAYISIFSPSTATSSALKNFGTNAKKSSLRSSVASQLMKKRFIHPALAAKLNIPKAKKANANPYFDFWAWSCRALEWCGPCEEAERVATSHHVLPIFMHHFGCATPSHESLQILKIVADGRPVAEIGSGNGYWTFLLRCYGLTVHPVDNMQSEWRVSWVNDTTISDGTKWLKGRNDGRDMVLLLVYPIVGSGAGGGVDGAFTRQLVDAYQGDTIAVVGTQNGNGYTSFKNDTMDQYMAREHAAWTQVIRIPLPSFPGKDEALYIFQCGDRAPVDA